MSDYVTKEELSEVISLVVRQTLTSLPGRPHELDDLTTKVDRITATQIELADALRKIDETIRGNGKPGIRQRLDTFEEMAKQSHEALFGDSNRKGMKQTLDRIECQSDQDHLSLHGDEKVRGLLDREYLVEDRISGIFRVVWIATGVFIASIVGFILNLVLTN